MALDDFLSFLQSPKSLSAAHRALRLHLAFPEGAGNDMLLPQQVYGTESICGGIEYVVLCLSTNASLPLKEFIAVPARIEFVTDRGGLRSVCGIVSRATAGNSDGGVATYELVVQDALALLDKRVNTRVFQGVTELEVIQAMHDEWLRINPVLVGTFDLEVDPLLQRHRFPKREMIRQYNESDAHFVQRLLRRGVRLVPQYDPRTDLPQTQMESAIVVGPQQEEVYCDRLGRVKVRFPQTRTADHKRTAGAGATDTDADSAWVRVASSWAGNGPGGQSQCGLLGLPRVGSEVLIAYLGGDPAADGAITQQSTGPHAVKSPQFTHIRVGAASPDGVTFPQTDLVADERFNSLSRNDWRTDHRAPI